MLYDNDSLVSVLLFDNGDFSMPTRGAKSTMNFKTTLRADIPQGRNGKHKQLITRILSDLDQLQKGAALKVALEDLGSSKEKVRSALNRAGRKDSRNIATASDREFLYIWNNG